MTTADEPVREGVVVPFPKIPADIPPSGALEPAPEVVEGELLTDEENAALDRRRGLQRIVPARVVVLVVKVRESPSGASVERFALRTTGVIHVTCQGFESWARRAWDASTLGVYRRQIKAAEAAGDRALLADWTERREQAVDRRHKRIMDLPQLLRGIVAVAGFTVAGLLVLLVVSGAIVWGADVAPFLAPASAALTVAGWVFSLIALAWTPAIASIPLWVCLAAWREGKRRSDTSWLSPASGYGEGDGDVMDELPDEGTIVRALHNLNIPGFNRALKAGWRLHFLMPPTIDGKGWRVQIDLPPASPVEEIVRRKPMLAHNLKRYPVEVWPTEPQASVLDLWVAKPGALSGPVDPWPLLENLDNTSTDYFAGVPVGVTIKGDVIRGRLSEANYVVGGMMGSGKSTLVITLILGAMLDLLVDIDVVVMAENADYEPMKPRLRSLVTGAGQETVETCLAMLLQLFEELSIRGQALREHDARAVTRKLAQQDERLRPRIMVIDECQNLFLGKHGKTAIETASKLMSTARKYAITLMFLTPEPSKDALPRKLITITSNKACFAIGDQFANDAVLGTGSYKTGISAVGLVPKTDEGPGDVGTCMARGFMAKPGLLRSFYIPQGDAHRVTQRALQLRTEQGIRGATGSSKQVEERDLLEDLAEVLGEEPVPAADVPALLSRLAPRWAPYRTMTGKSLRAGLAEEGIKVASTGNRWPVDPAAVRAALARRSTADLDDE